MLHGDGLLISMLYRSTYVIVVGLRFEMLHSVVYDISVKRESKKFKLNKSDRSSPVLRNKSNM